MDVYAEDPYRGRWRLVEDAGARLRDAAVRGADLSDTDVCPYDEDDVFGAVCARVWSRERWSARLVAAVWEASAVGRDVDSGGNPYSADSDDPVEQCRYRVWEVARRVTIRRNGGGR